MNSHRVSFGGIKDVNYVQGNEDMYTLGAQITTQVLVDKQTWQQCSGLGFWNNRLENKYALSDHLIR